MVLKAQEGREAALLSALPVRPWIGCSHLEMQLATSRSRLLGFTYIPGREQECPRPGRGGPVSGYV